MSRISIIKQRLKNDPDFDGLTDQEAQDFYNQAISVKQVVLTNDVYKYLLLIGKLSGIEAGTSAVAKKATRILALYEDEALDLKDPLVEGLFNSTLSDLVSEGLIDTTNETIIKAMGNKQTTRAKEDGLNVVGLAEIVRTRK